MSKFEERISLLIGVIILIVLVGLLLGWNQGTIDKVISFIVPLGISFALTAFVGEMLEGFNLVFLKDVLLTTNIWKFKISLSLFTLLTLIIKIWLF